jgi:hypothetical protein
VDDLSTHTLDDHSTHHQQSKPNNLLISHVNIEDTTASCISDSESQDLSTITEEDNHKHVHQMVTTLGTIHNTPIPDRTKQELAIMAGVVVDDEPPTQSSTKGKKKHPKVKVKVPTKEVKVNKPWYQIEAEMRIARNQEYEREREFWAVMNRKRAKVRMSQLEECLEPENSSGSNNTSSSHKQNLNNLRIQSLKISEKSQEPNPNIKPEDHVSPTSPSANYKSTGPPPEPPPHQPKHHDHPTHTSEGNAEFLIREGVIFDMRNKTMDELVEAIMHCRDDDGGPPITIQIDVDQQVELEEYICAPDRLLGTSSPRPS